MLIAVVWILPEEKRLFNMYPEVLYIDVTSDTNKEKRPLFTITGRTALGIIYTLMRAYLPNQTVEATDDIAAAICQIIARYICLVGQPRCSLIGAYKLDNY